MVFWARSVSCPNSDLLIHHLFPERGTHEEKLYEELRTHLYSTPQCRALRKSRTRLRNPA